MKRQFPIMILPAGTRCWREMLHMLVKQRQAIHDYGVYDVHRSDLYGFLSDIHETESRLVQARRQLHEGPLLLMHDGIPMGMSVEIYAGSLVLFQDCPHIDGWMYGAFLDLRACRRPMNRMMAEHEQRFAPRSNNLFFQPLQLIILKPSAPILIIHFLRRIQKHEHSLVGIHHMITLLSGDSKHFVPGLAIEVMVAQHLNECFAGLAQQLINFREL